MKYRLDEIIVISGNNYSFCSFDGNNDKIIRCANTVCDYCEFYRRNLVMHCILNCLEIYKLIRRYET